MLVAWLCGWSVGVSAVCALCGVAWATCVVGLAEGLSAAGWLVTAPGVVDGCRATSADEGRGCALSDEVGAVVAAT